jgi:UDP-N-acetylglucosamine 4,6-dehydratase
MGILDLDIIAIKKIVEEQTILITGGTGTFGNKITEILLKNTNPKKIIIFSRDEFKQYNMKNKFKDFLNKIKFVIGDIRNKDSLNLALKNVDIVFHAAALKQVDTIENNPIEAIKTNIYGTENVVLSAIYNNVKYVIGISTDKCVSPVNLYGATKLCLEKLIINGNELSDHKTKFSVLRYGNVMGSRGSVIPLFIEQSKQNKFTVTDENMTRFTLTIQEAINFVLNCLTKMIGGEIFVPRLPSYSIKQLVHIINPDAEINIIGIRPGEKLYETMISEHESANSIECIDYFVIQSSHTNDTRIFDHYKDDQIHTEGLLDYNSENNIRIDNTVLYNVIFNN